MEQGEQYTASNTTGWHVVSADRVTVVPVQPGMTIGETESGELSFDRANAQLELDIDNNAALVVRALGGIQLATEDKQPAHSLTFRRSVEVSLSQNTLMLNTEFVSFAPSKRPLRLRVIYPPVDMVVTEAPTDSIDSEHLDEKTVNEVMSSAQSTGMTSGALLESPQQNSWTNQDPTRVLKKRKALTIFSVVVALLVLGLVVFYPRSSTPPPSDIVDKLQTADSQLPKPASVGQNQQSEEKPKSPTPSVSAVTVPVEILPPPETYKSVESPSPVATPQTEEVQQTSDEQVPTTPPQAAEILEEIALEETAQAAAQKAAQEKAQEAAQEAAQKQAAQEEAARKQAEQEKLAQAEAAKARALERDLVAADVALEEGRLLVPEESSALALYSRVLSQDPESTDALRGIAKVKEQLINRAFAQLAAGDWAQASLTLDAAEQAGASGNLVADLRGEANYQLRLAQARKGQFDGLYPAQQLIAIEQDMPQLTRWRRGGHAPVDVEFTITMGGEVRDVQILGNPPSRLAEAIGRAVETWRFEPVLENGRPLPVRTRVTIEVGS